jgi:hypothetical protein
VGSEAWIASFCLALALAGCGSSAQRGPTANGSQSDEAQGPSASWDTLIQHWKQELLAASDQDRDVKFPTPSQHTFRQRLDAAATAYGFRVLRVDWVPAPQGSPLAIVEASSPSRFSDDTPAIADALDPKKPGGQDWQGWDYEGFMLGAQDESGDPFLAVYNFQRDHGGGQWARIEDLYPYEHG